MVTAAQSMRGHAHAELLNRNNSRLDVYIRGNIK